MPAVAAVIAVIAVARIRHAGTPAPHGSARFDLAHRTGRKQSRPPTPAHASGKAPRPSDSPAIAGSGLPSLSGSLPARLTAARRSCALITAYTRSDARRRFVTLRGAYGRRQALPSITVPERLRPLSGQQLRCRVRLAPSQPIAPIRTTPAVPGQQAVPSYPNRPIAADRHRPEPAGTVRELPADCVTRTDPARSTTGAPSDRLGNPRRPIGTAPNFPGHSKPSVANDSEPQPAATGHPSRTPSNRSLPPPTIRPAPRRTAACRHPHRPYPRPRSRPAGPLPETPRQKNRSSFRRRPPPTTASRSTIPVTASAASCHRLARNCRR